MSHGCPQRRGCLPATLRALPRCNAQRLPAVSSAVRSGKQGDAQAPRVWWQNLHGQRLVRIQRGGGPRAKLGTAMLAGAHPRSMKRRCLVVRSMWFREVQCLSTQSTLSRQLRAARRPGRRRWELGIKASRAARSTFERSANHMLLSAVAANQHPVLCRAPLCWATLGHPPRFGAPVCARHTPGNMAEEWGESFGPFADMDSQRACASPSHAPRFAYCSHYRHAPGRRAAGGGGDCKVHRVSEGA